VRLPSFGKLQSLKNLKLYSMRNLKYLDDVVRVFSSLEVLILDLLPNLEGLVKVERGEVFSCLSILKIAFFPKLELSCLPSLKDLDVSGRNNVLLRSISCLCGLTKPTLDGGNRVTSFPEGMFRNLTCLQTLYVTDFLDLKVLSNEPFHLALEDLYISTCNELESLPEKMRKGMQSL